MPRAVALLAVVILTGCAARSGEGPTPAIQVSPGVAARLALMDRYRLHDEDRKRMMQRPRVWVEEVPEEDPASEPAPGEAEAATAAPAPAPDAISDADAAR